MLACCLCVRTTLEVENPHTFTTAPAITACGDGMLPAQRHVPTRTPRPRPWCSRCPRSTLTTVACLTCSLLPTTVAPTPPLPPMASFSGRCPSCPRQCLATPALGGILVLHDVLAPIQTSARRRLPRTEDIRTPHVATRRGWPGQAVAQGVTVAHGATVHVDSSRDSSRTSDRIADCMVEAYCGERT